MAATLTAVGLLLVAARNRFDVDLRTRFGALGLRAAGLAPWRRHCSSSSASTSMPFSSYITPRRPGIRSWTDSGSSSNEPAASTARAKARRCHGSRPARPSPRVATDQGSRSPPGRRPPRRAVRPAAQRQQLAGQGGHQGGVHPLLDRLVRHPTSLLIAAADRQPARNRGPATSPDEAASSPPYAAAATDPWAASWAAPTPLVPSCRRHHIAGFGDTVATDLSRHHRLVPPIRLAICPNSNPRPALERSPPASQGQHLPHGEVRSHQIPRSSATTD